MNIDIRKSIMDNFKGTNEEEIHEAINDSIKDKDEIILPGLGVFFEIIWYNSSKAEQEKMVKNIKSYLNK